MSETVEFVSFRPNLPVRDVERAIAFYRDVIGLDVAHAEPGGSFALLRSGGAELALVRDANPPPLGAYLYVRGLNVVYDRCLAGGAPIVYPITLEPWGLRNFGVEDPDGHRIAIGEWV